MIVWFPLQSVPMSIDIIQKNVRTLKKQDNIAISSPRDDFTSGC